MLSQVQICKCRRGVHCELQLLSTVDFHIVQFMFHSQDFNIQNGVFCWLSEIVHRSLPMDPLFCANPSVKRLKTLILERGENVHRLESPQREKSWRI